MKERDYEDFVQDILDSINDVENFIDGMEFGDLYFSFFGWRNECGGGVRWAKN